MKKIFTLFTVVAVLLSFFPTTVFAVWVSHIDEGVEVFYGENVFPVENIEVGDGLYALKQGNEVKLYEYEGPGGDIVIPDGITAISGSTFGGSNITSVIIPDSVTKIGDRAFIQCPNLTSVTMPDSVTEIGEDIFWECTNLTDVTLSKNITEIPRGTFKGCSSLANVVIPNGVTRIGDEAFGDCSSLTEIMIPDSVTIIDIAFYGCTGLSAITIPDSVEEICFSAFDGCLNLEEINIPSTTKFVIDVYDGDTWDWDMAKTTDGEKYLSGIEFFGNKYVYIRDVDIPEYTQGWTATHRTANEILHLFTGNPFLTRINLPDRLTEIDAYVLSGCVNLVHVAIPSSVTKIGGSSFLHCKSLPCLFIPASVTEIYEGAFAGCTNLSVICFAGMPQISRDCFKEGFVAPELRNDSLGQLHFLVGYPDTEMYSYAGAHWATTAYASGLGLQNYLAPQSGRITNQSNQICAGLTSDYEKAKAVYTWMAENIAYDYDYRERRKSEVVTDPEGVLDCKLTVCDGYARLTRALLQAQGIPTMYITGPADGPRSWEEHAWNAAYIKEQGRWIYMDSTWGRGRKNDMETGEETTYLNQKYFDISPYILSLDHHADPIPDASFSVSPSQSSVAVNGKRVQFDAYNICGNNYFKLRDLAAALNGTEKQFNVTWDNGKAAVNIMTSSPYTPVGGELIPGDGREKQGKVNASSAYLDGMQFLLPAYNIEGNNYVKLRDIGELLDFNVSWDRADNVIRIDTGEAYTAD